MDKHAKILVAGHTGLVNSAITRQLKSQDYDNLLLIDFRDMDLTNQKQTQMFFDKNKPEYVFLAAAKVGGIVANNNLQNSHVMPAMIRKMHEAKERSDKTVTL